MVDCPFVSIVMAVRNEDGFIERSVAAVLNQTYPRQRMEMIIADGMSTDNTRVLLNKIAANDSRIRILDNPKRIVAAGLNAAMAVCRGEIIVRVDGHCEITPTYVERCVAHLSKDKVDGVGGSVETIGKTHVAQVIARAMSSTFGVGNSAFRTRQGQTLYVDTIPFPAYRRSVIKLAGNYDEELVRNQDDEYNYRLRELGAKLLLAADVKSKYYSRSSLRSLWSQYYQYGYWKVRVMQRHPRQMNLRQFVPPGFMATLILTGCVGIVLPNAAIVFLATGSLYALFNLVASSWICRRDLRMLPLMPLALAALHFSYGLGFLAGVIQFREGFKFRVMLPSPPEVR